MRCLVYGAGNIGCLYAARLAQSSEDVSVLARGARAAQIRESGIQLEHGVSGERTTTFVPVVERLGPEDAYDLVLVALPKHRVAEVLPVLSANRQTPNVLFFCNNAAGPRKLIDALGSERVMLGFPGAAGFPRGEVIRYVITSKREQPTTLGELDGHESSRIARLAAMFQRAGFPTSVCSNMDAWLKTHVAEVLPTLCALRRAGGGPKELATNPEALRLMLRSIREGHQVLRANSVPITPANHRMFDWMPQALLLFAMKHKLSDETATIKVGHAEQSLDEWRLLAKEFGTLIRQAGVPTPSIDQLYVHLGSSGGIETSATDVASSVRA